MDIVNEILWQSLVIFLWIGSVLGFAVGVAMLFTPAKARQWNQFFARWIDTHGLETALDRPRWTERFVYRHHRLVGTLLLAGSFFVIYKFLLRKFDDTIGPLAASDHFGLWQATAALFAIGGVIGAVIGAIMVAKPSLLREIEVASNRWISTESFLELFNRAHGYLDQVIFDHRKIVGTLLILASAYIFFRLGILLLNNHWAF